MNKDKPEKEMQQKEKPKETNKDAIKDFIGKDVTVSLRGKIKLKGRLEMTTNYELILTINKLPVLIMKHAIDFVELDISK